MSTNLIKINRAKQNKHTPKTNRWYACFVSIIYLRNKAIMVDGLFNSVILIISLIDNEYHSYLELLKVNNHYNLVK